MILETIRCVVDALENNDYGVSQQIRDLSIDSEDERPREVAEILDVTRSRSLNRDNLPLNDPWIAILQDGPAVGDGEARNTVNTDTRVNVTILWGTRREGDEVLPEALYTCRAIVRSIRTMLKNENLADRTRNDVCILSAASLSFGPVDEDFLDGAARAAVQVDFDVRDLAP